MSAQSSWLDLVGRAEDDYAIALSALRRKKPLTYPSTFHAQQCAEKYLKAMLAARRQRFSLVHDLVKLNAECGAAGIFTGFSNTDLAILSEYAVKTCYVGASRRLKRRGKFWKLPKAFANLRENY